MEIKKSDCIAEMQLLYKTKVKPSERPKISSSQDSYKQFQQILDENSIEHVETMYILMLNRANKVLGWYILSKGGVAGTVCDVKVVLQLALNSNASAFILAHNHPSGNLTPSQDDIRLTKKINEASKLLDITLFDHLILSTEGYLSMQDEGLF